MDEEQMIPRERKPIEQEMHVLRHFMFVLGAGTRLSIVVSCICFLGSSRTQEIYSVSLQPAQHLGVSLLLRLRNPLVLVVAQHRETVRDTRVYLQLVLETSLLHILLTGVSDLVWKQRVALNSHHAGWDFNAIEIRLGKNSVRDRAALDHGTLANHTFLRLCFWCALTLSDILMQLAAQQQNVLGAEAVSSRVDSAAVCVCVGVLLFDRSEDAVEAREDLLRRVSCKPHVDCE